MLKSLTKADKITPARTKNGTEVSHILFVDDILIFTKADSVDVEVVKDLFTRFASYFGLIMNPNKIHFFIGKIPVKLVFFLA